MGDTMNKFKLLLLAVGLVTGMINCAEGMQQESAVARRLRKNIEGMASSVCVTAYNYDGEFYALSLNNREKRISSEDADSYMCLKSGLCQVHEGWNGWLALIEESMENMRASGEISEEDFSQLTAFIQEQTIYLNKLRDEILHKATESMNGYVAGVIDSAEARNIYKRGQAARTLAEILPILRPIAPCNHYIHQKCLRGWFLGVACPNCQSMV